jgi:hypothetical protein
MALHSERHFIEANSIIMMLLDDQRFEWQQRKIDVACDTRRIDFLLQPLCESLELWDSIVAKSPGATIYHGGPWLKLIERTYNLNLLLATIQNGGEPLAGCVLARGKSPFRRRFASLPFSDTGRPLAVDDKAEALLLRLLAKQGPRGAAYEIRGVKAAEPWQSVDFFVNWTLRLDRPAEELEKDLALNFRRNLKRGRQQNIRIDRGSDNGFIRRFYALQLESRRRQGIPPQPWRFFKFMQETFAANGNLDVWIARENGEDVASVVFLSDGDTVYYKWGARRAGSSSTANHLLFWHALEQFAQKRRILDLGRTDSRNEGLMRFKHQLGASPVPLPISYYPRCPSQPSSEVLTGSRRFASEIIKRLPIGATRVVGEVLYGFLA